MTEGLHGDKDFNFWDLTAGYSLLIISVVVFAILGAMWYYSYLESDILLLFTVIYIIDVAVVLFLMYVSDGVQERRRSRRARRRSGSERFWRSRQW